jgi:hypothetical protein
MVEIRTKYGWCYCWLDMNGVYQLAGGSDLKHLFEPILEIKE